MASSSWGLAFEAQSAEPQCRLSGRHVPGDRVPSVLEVSPAQLRLPCPPQHVLLGLGFQELSWDHTSPEEEEAALWLEFDGDSEGTPVNKLLKIYSKQVGSVYSCSLPPHPRLPLPCPVIPCGSFLASCYRPLVMLGVPFRCWRSDRGHPCVRLVSDLLYYLSSFYTYILGFFFLK